MQNYLSPGTLVRAFERVLVRATALVGCDLNRALRYWHMESTLQFVPGLGARKARALLMQIRAQLSARKARGSGSQYSGSDRGLTCREDLRDGRGSEVVRAGGG